MKKICVFLLLIVNSVFAQSWQPYPVSQQSFYRYTNPSTGQALIDLVVMDSIDQGGSSQFLYFKRKIGNPGAMNCRDSLVANFSPVIFNPDSGALDSMILNGDTLFNMPGVYPGIYFLPFAQPGESWTMQPAVTSIFCDSIAYGYVLGMPDSLKYYHTSGSIGTLPIVLSKTYGFVTWLYFNPANASIRLYELEGITMNGNVIGFDPPKMEDYFPYNGGDILLWQNDIWQSSPGGLIHTAQLFRDSITSVDRYADSIRVNYNRQIQDSTFQITIQNGKSDLYTRIGVGQLLEGLPNDVAPANLDNLNNGIALMYGTGPYLMWDDSVTGTEAVEREFSAIASFFTYDSCYIDHSIIIDMGGLYYTYNSHLGLIKKDELNLFFGQTIQLLIGAQIGGNSYGNTDLLNTVTEPSLSSFAVYPNPANDLVNISSAKSVSIKLTDLFGRELRRLNLNAGQNIIDLSELSPGIYLLSATGSNRAERLVKK